MTDEQIIKGLTICFTDSDTEESLCEYCPYQNEARCAREIVKDVLDLIKRQKAEIDKLVKEMTES